jgi:hypothetical protein
MLASLVVIGCDVVVFVVNEEMQENENVNAALTGLAMKTNRLPNKASTVVPCVAAMFAVMDAEKTIQLYN